MENPAGKSQPSPENSSKKFRSRKAFLKLCGITGVAVFGGAAFSLLRGMDPVFADDLGVSTGNTGVENRENLVKALEYSRRRVIFPPGDYAIDNSTDFPERGLDPGSLYVIVNRFEGEFTMEDGARLVFTDKRRRGLYFQGGEGATFRGFSSTFREPLPDERVVPEECILFVDTTDTVVENASVNGSAAAGILFHRCVRPEVFGAEITNTQADGLHFANCQDARAESIRTENTGDDGLAFVNYADEPGYTGGYASNITIRNSEGRGIAVVGQSGVVIEGFDVDQTSVSGLICARDASYDTRVSSNVLFRDGSVRGAGRFPGQEANKYGIEIDAVHSVEFRGISIESPAGRGVSGVATRMVRGSATNGAIRLADIEASRVEADAGFSLYGKLDDDGTAAGAYELENLTARDVGGTGFIVLGGGFVRCENLVARDASKNGGENRAFEFGRNALVEGSHLHVLDEREDPTGFEVFTHGAQSGSLGVLHDGVSNGGMEVENQSGLSYITPPAHTIVPGLEGDGSGSGARLVWSGHEPGGVVRYELERSVDGGEYTGVPLDDATLNTATLSLEAGRAYTLRVRAVGRAGEAGVWATGEAFKPPA